MQTIITASLVALLFLACTTTGPPQSQGKGLKKVRYSSPETVQQLRQAGADIIVQEPDYVIIRTDSMSELEAFQLESFSEKELVQRLVHIELSDSSDLQQVVNSGVDVWEVRGDTVVGQAFDIYIEKLRQMGFTVNVVARNARQPEGDRE